MEDTMKAKFAGKDIEIVFGKDVVKEAYDNLCKTIKLGTEGVYFNSKYNFIMRNDLIAINNQHNNYLNLMILIHELTHGVSIHYNFKMDESQVLKIAGFKNTSIAVDIILFLNIDCFYSIYKRLGRFLFKRRIKTLTEIIDFNIPNDACSESEKTLISFEIAKFLTENFEIVEQVINEV